MTVTLADKAADRDAETKLVKHEGDADPFYKRVNAATIAECLPHEDAMDIVNTYSRYCEDFNNVSLNSVVACKKELRFNNEFWTLSPVAVGNLASFGGRALVKKHRNCDANPGVRALRAYHEARSDPNSEAIFEMIAADMLSHMSGHSKALIRVFMKGEVGDINWDCTRRIDALLTSKYGIIDNQWLLNTIGGLAKGSWADFRFKGRLVSGHYHIADEARREEAEYGATLAIRNAEDGRASLTICPSVFDWISGTGIIFGGMQGEVMKRVHRGTIDALQLRAAISDHINEQMPLFDSCVQHINDLKQIALDSEELKAVLYDVGSREGMTLDERAAWFKNVEVEMATRCEKLGLSAYALVMGLARTAGCAEDDERSTALSTIAGRLATPAGGTLMAVWKRISARASTADADKVAAAFKGN